MHTHTNRSNCCLLVRFSFSVVMLHQVGCKTLAQSVKCWSGSGTGMRWRAPDQEVDGGWMSVQYVQ